VFLFFAFVFVGCVPKRAILVSRSVIEKKWTLIEEFDWRMGPDKDNVFLVGKNKVFKHTGSNMKAALLYPFDEKCARLMACWTKAPRASTDFTKDSDIVTVLFLDDRAIVGEKGYQIKFELIFDEKESEKIRGFNAIIVAKDGAVMKSTIWDSRFPQNK